MKLEVLIFDVNETLLDLAALDPLFARHFGSPAWRKAWFSEMLVTAMTLNHVGRYQSFPDIGRACLATTAARARVRLTREAADEILHGMRSLAPHPDVVPGLKRLSEAGFKLAALTNSPYPVARAQLEHAGLMVHFGECITVEEAGHLKPAREVYAAAERRLEAPAPSLMLVAAHTWDLAGAAHAGWRTALITRGNQVAHPLHPTPTVTAPDLVAAAEKIANLH